MHFGSIRVDPSVLHSQGLGHAAADGHGGRPRGPAGPPGAFAQAMAAQQAATTRPSAHHMAQVHAASQHGGVRGRRRAHGDPQFHVDDAHYAEAVQAALGHGRRPRAAQLRQTQGLVAASMNMFQMPHGFGSDDDEE